MNAGCALFAAGKADTIGDGIELAREMIRSGKAAETLEKYIKLSNE